MLFDCEWVPALRRIAYDTTVIKTYAATWPRLLKKALTDYDAADPAS
jgi:hypothetical protein